MDYCVPRPGPQSILPGPGVSTLLQEDKHSMLSSLSFAGTRETSPVGESVTGLFGCHQDLPDMDYLIYMLFAYVCTPLIWRASALPVVSNYPLITA